MSILDGAKAEIEGDASGLHATAKENLAVLRKKSDTTSQRLWHFTIDNWSMYIFLVHTLTNIDIHYLDNKVPLSRASKLRLEVNAFYLRQKDR